MTTITYVGAGAAATGNNAGVAPGAISGIAVGDLVLIFASIRNTGTGAVTLPAGWTGIASLGSSGAIEVMGRIWQAGDAMPTITFTSGVANADTMARGFALRGIAPDVLTSVVGSPDGPLALNGSAQNIAYPALNVPGGGQAVLMFAWKQDDATSLTTPAGFTAIGLTSTTTGDDASQAMYYQIQTTEADITAGSITVTGGAAAISGIWIAALKPAAVITTDVQDVWPPRVQITITGLVVGDSVDLYRETAGVRTLVRGSSTDAVIDSAYVVIDAELPFGVPVTYVAIVNNAAVYSAGPTTYDLPGGKVALSDAISGAAAEVAITAAGDQTNGRNSSRMRVGGRNVVVTGPAGQPEGSYEIYTETTSAHENLLDLLASATQATVQIRSVGIAANSGDPYAEFDAYLTVDAWTVRRWSQDGDDARRLTTIEWAETDGWASSLMARGFTLQDLADYTGGANTLLDIQSLGAGTLLGIAQLDLS